MSYNYCKDHRSGITYVYDVSSYVGEDGTRKTSRKLIGKLDDNGNLIPTSGRRGRLPKNREDTITNGDHDSSYRERIADLELQITELRNTVDMLRKEKDLLVNGLKQLLGQVR